MYLFWLSLIYFWQVLDKSLPFLVLIIAICAIYVAIQSKHEARVAAHGSLFYQQMVRYSSNEMHEALRIIGELFDLRSVDETAFLKVVKKYHNKEFRIEVRWEIVESNISYSQMFYHQHEVINQARYTVLQFFTLSSDLFTEFEVLDDVYFKKICNISTFKFLYHVIEWLELAINPKYNRKTFTNLLEQSGRKDIEYLKNRRPPETWTEIEQMMEPNQPQSE